MNYYKKKCDGVMHVIRQGDTLYRLSRMYDVSVDEIMDANPEINVYNLQIGSTVCVPMEMPVRPGFPGMPQPPMRPQPPQQPPMQPQPPATPAPPAPPMTPMPPNDDMESPAWPPGVGEDWMIIQPYLIKEGDSLNSLLHQFNMDFDTFARFNPQIMPIALPTGETVYVKRMRPEPRGNM